jgi:hypothetical protein
MRAGMTVSLLSAIALAAGCASPSGAYMDADDRRMGPADSSWGISFDDASIQDAFQLPEQLAVPLKLATVGIERNPYGVYLDREADELDQRLAKDRVTFRDVVPLVDFLFSGRERGTLDLDRIRRVAARAHAEALLIYDQKVRVESSYNLLCLLNLTIVGAYVVPGLSYELTMETRAALVDVRNGVIYAVVRDTRSVRELAPTGTADNCAKEAKRRLRQESFDALATSLRDKIDRNLAQKEAPRAPSVRSLRYQTVPPSDNR